MTATIIQLVRLFFPLVLGGVIGFGVYKYFGCRSGVCAITSNPYISIGYGALIGYILTK